MENNITGNFYLQIKSIVSKYNTNNIFIIGKGSSIDSVDLGLTKGNLIININDSGICIPGDICIFHKEWVVKSLHDNKIQHSLYITDIKDEISNKLNVINLNFVPFNEETKDLLIYRFLKEDMKLEEILFVTALKVCKMIYLLKKEIQNVYMIGFDFDISGKVYSEKIKVDYSGDYIDFKDSFIRMQEFYLMSILNLFEEEKDKGLKIIYVGKKSYSKLNNYQFNQLFRHKIISKRNGINKKYIKIGKSDKPSGIKTKKGKVLVVAEFTNNHLGDINRLCKMVKLAKDAGADLIKVQRRDIDNFYSKEELNSYYYSPYGTTFGEYRRGVELTLEGFEALDGECKKSGIEWFASVLDFNSFLFLRKFNLKLIKIPSTISTHKDYHLKIAENYKGALVVSTGFTSREYEDYIQTVFKENKKIYILQTTSAYPTPPGDCCVSVVRHYSYMGIRNPKIIPGYSSHDIGSLGSMLAVAAGAKMIEKHVKISKTDWIPFDKVALDLSNNEFKNFIRDVHLAESMCGEESKEIRAGEYHKYF